MYDQGAVWQFLFIASFVMLNEDIGWEVDGFC